MNDFLLTLFLLLVILILYSALIQRKKSQPTATKKHASELSRQSFSSSTPLSSASDNSDIINTSKTNSKPSQATQPSSSSLSSTFNNSKISSQSNHQSLAQNIENWGESNSSNNISPILNYLTHSDPSIRMTVAKALGKLVRMKAITTQMRQAVLALGRLSRDPVVSVRLSAVEALGKIKSPLVIPFLKVAQKDFNSDVIKSASAALNYFKGYSLASQKKATHKPKNGVQQLPLDKND